MKTLKLFILWLARNSIAELNKKLSEQDIALIKLNNLLEEKTVSLAAKEEQVLILEAENTALKTQTENLKEQIIPESDKDRHIINLNISIKKIKAELEEQKQITQKKNDEINKIKNL